MLKLKAIYHSKPLVLCGVLGFWLLCLIEVAPQDSEVHKRLDHLIHPVLDKTSLWQGNWELFAPVIDHWNTRLECVITWEDGTEARWSTIDWTHAGYWERMKNFRRNEYFDNVIANRGSLLWPALSDHIVKQMSVEHGKTARWADLVYLGETLPSPMEHWKPAYTAPEFRDPETFYSWNPHEISESEVMLFGH